MPQITCSYQNPVKSHRPRHPRGLRNKPRLPLDDQGVQGWQWKDYALVSPEVDRSVGFLSFAFHWPLYIQTTPHAQGILSLSLCFRKWSPARWGSPGLALRSLKPGLEVCISGSLEFQALVLPLSSCLTVYTISFSDP